MGALSITIRPEFFRLPVRGVDPHFGLSRSFYYHLDTTGQVLLVRVRNRGSQRGITLVNYDAVSTFLAKAAEGQTEGKDGDVVAPRSASTPAAGNACRLVHQHPRDMELMRKLAPKLLHDVLKTIVDLEQFVQAASG